MICTEADNLLAVARENIESENYEAAAAQSALAAALFAKLVYLYGTGF